MPVTNADIMHKLGTVEADIRHAEKSRGVLHQKVEQQSDAINQAAQALVQVSQNLQINSQIATQARDVAQAALENVKRFEANFNAKVLPMIEAGSTFQKDSEPILKQMKIVRNIIYALFGAGVLTAGTFFAMVIWARDLLRVLIAFVIGQDISIS
jgi:methyl-accepting chemotaxis protein